MARRARVAPPAQQAVPRQQRGSFDGGADVDHASAGFERPDEVQPLAGAALSVMLAPVAAAQMRGGR